MLKLKVLTAREGRAGAGAGYGMDSGLQARPEPGIERRPRRVEARARPLTQGSLSPGNNLPADKYTQRPLWSLQNLK